MAPESSEPLHPPQLDRTRVVVDANVFAHTRWMRAIVQSARAGHITLLWSPAIITEASRVRLWVRIRRSDGNLNNAWKCEAFDEAHRWFEIMTAVFHVVEDRPPHEPQWTESPSDLHDRPIWTAAVRSNAHFVVTENLKDGPPEDKDGHRVWGKTVYVHPDQFLDFLEGWASIVEGARPIALEGEDHSVAPLVDAPGPEVELSPLVRRVLLAAEMRAQDELPPAE